MVRALGFVAHRPTSGFTAFGSESPSLRWHLTHGPRHHLGPGSLTLVRPFAAHSRPLRRCAATTASSGAPSPATPRAPPLPIPRFTVYLFWHERVELDPGHAWLRARLVEVAAQVSRAKGG